jgi:hypothetical protein
MNAGGRQKKQFHLEELHRGTRRTTRHGNLSNGGRLRNQAPAGDFLSFVLMNPDQGVYL